MAGGGRLVDVADAWQLIAAVWGWPPSELEHMGMPELAEWTRRAQEQLRRASEKPRRGQGMRW